MDKITKVDELFRQITNMLPCIYDKEVTDEFKETHFLTDPDGTNIFSTERNDVETIANIFDQLYGEGTCCTGEMGMRCGEPDAYTGLYYVNIS